MQVHLGAGTILRHHAPHFLPHFVSPHWKSGSGPLLLGEMLLYNELHKFKVNVKPLDVSHVMWSELRSAVSECKCPIMGPF